MGASLRELIVGRRCISIPGKRNAPGNGGMDVEWRLLSSVTATVLALAAPALAGPEFIELSDAGSGASTATPVMGEGPLNGIQGRLTGKLLAGDFEDMYLIRIADPLSFNASTAISMGGSTDFDTQLWIFTFMAGTEPSALGLLANDEIFAKPPGPSTIRPAATDGSGAVISVPGLYYIAITGFDDDPVSIAGPIFDQVDRTEISGPDGVGGSLPHESWTAEGDVGEYRIALLGAEFIECEGDANGDGTVDPLDAGFVLARFGCPVDTGDPDCDAADVNDDGAVDPLDVGYVLARFGPCF